MAQNYKKWQEGLTVVPKTTTASDSQGELEVLTSDGKMRYHNGSSNSPVVTEAHAATLTNKSIDADQNTITNIENADIKAAAAIDATKIANGSVSNTEFQYLDGVTSPIQTQLDGKASNALTSAHIYVGNGSNVATDVAVSGDVTIDNTGNVQIVAGTIVDADINATAAIDASKIANGTVSNTEFQFLDGVTSGIQTQIDSKVTGPASSTDNHVVRFDGITGKLVQDGSPVVISDAGAISGLTGITSSGTAGLATVTASGSVGITGALDANGVISFASVNDAATGSNITLTAPTTKVIRLTGASLSSIDGIPAGSDAQEIILENATGAVITLNNDTGATTANRIYTGTGANLTLANNAALSLSYDITTSRWRVIGGSGSGTSSGINYVTNGTAEAGTTGWATYANAAGTVPVDGTGGSPSVTLAASTSSPLRGTQSFLFTKDAANRQGQGASYDFTIDSADKTSILAISMDYEVSTNYVDTVAGNLVSSDMQVFVYDVTNAQLIYCDTQNIAATATEGHLVTTFQTASNSTSYRLIFHVASTNANSYTVKFDNIQVGPKPLIKGAIVTDWQSYTPTFSAGLGTVSNIQFKWRQVGDSYEVKGTFEAGTVAASVAYLTLPNNATIDSNKMSAFPNEILGTYNQTNAGGGSGVWTVGVGGVVGWQSSDSTKIYFGYLNSADAASTVTELGVNGNTIFNNGANVFVHFYAPISGKSSNLVLSEDSGNKLIVAEATLTTTQTGITSKVIPFNNIIKDTVAGFNSGTYTVPETGDYFITATALMTNADAITNANLQIRKNTSGIRQAFGSALNATSTSVNLQICDVISCIKGDTLDIFVTGDASFDLDSNGARTSVAIYKISSPQTLAGSEVVAARGVQSSGQSIPNNSATTMIYDSAKIYDTHGALNTSTGVFTAPVSGYYWISNGWMAVSASWTAVTHQAGIHFYKNGVNYSESYLFFQASTTNNVNWEHHDVIYLTKNDTLEVKLDFLRGAATALVTNPARNYTTIQKVG